MIGRCVSRVSRVTRERSQSIAITSIAVVAALLGTTLHAHLAFPTHYSARTSIALRASQPQQLQIAVTLELPLDELILAFNDYYRDVDLIAEIERGRSAELEETFRQNQFERFAAGLTVTIDERPAGGRFAPAPTPINGRASEGFFVYILEWKPEQAPVLRGRSTITVTNALFSDKQVVRANLIETLGWRLLETSTPQPPPGADLSLGSDEEAALWSEDPDRRSFVVRVERL